MADTDNNPTQGKPEEPPQAPTPPPSAPQSIGEMSMCETQFANIWSDIHLMLEYAKTEGKAVPTTIRDAFAELCYGEDQETPGVPAPSEGGPPSAPGAAAQEQSAGLRA